MKLLIADDEHLIRKGIRFIIHNSNLEFDSIFEAHSGREAVNLARQYNPEIILMDIKMPGLDGLNAAKEIKKFLECSIVVFLTAYDRFDFAQEAIRCQARDYLLKPVTPQSLIDILQSCIEEINRINWNKRKEERLTKTLSTARDSIEELLVKELVAGTLSLPHQLLSQLRIIAPTGGGPWFSEQDLPNTCIVLQADDDRLSREAVQTVKDYLAQRSTYPFIADIIDRKMVLLASIPGQDQDQVEKSVHLAEQIIEALPCSIRIGIGRVRNNPGLLHLSYAEALESLSYGLGGAVRGVHEDNRITHIDDVNKAKLFSRPYQQVQQATDYIEKHFDRKISLEEVAQHVYLHPTYLSTIIKQETGYTFTDYVTFIRVKKAKQLLKSRLSIKEVAQKVGYSDSNYFCRVFKKVTGITPTDYRIKRV
jgi:two-component system response regulator YesN